MLQQLKEKITALRKQSSQTQTEYREAQKKLSETGQVWIDARGEAEKTAYKPYNAAWTVWNELLEKKNKVTYQLNSLEVAYGILEQIMELPNGYEKVEVSPERAKELAELYKDEPTGGCMALGESTIRQMAQDKLRETFYPWTEQFEGPAKELLKKLSEETGVKFEAKLSLTVSLPDTYSMCRAITIDCK